MLHRNINKSLVKKTFIVTAITTAMVIPVAAAALAWCTSQSASVSCVNGADIHVSFSNTETDKSNAMNVVAKDSQTGQSTDLGTIGAQETKSGDIATGKSSIDSGTITYYLTWANGQSGSDTRSVGYGAITCQMPTPTQGPSETPVPTPTCEETPTPTVTPTETPTATPTVTVTPTVTPSVTVTPTPITVVVTATPTPTPNTPTINVVVQAASVTATPEAPKVQAAPKTQELPKTGAETDILFGLLSLIPVGLKLRKMK
ncbi:MAG TPA: hypothetical protein VLG12_00610 [Candidatus Saccharimonadales bacterium]|nr:hypothetical protein [Candidatus Saccharimonadales bacterium]